MPEPKTAWFVSDDEEFWLCKKKFESYEAAESWGRARFSRFFTARGELLTPRAVAAELVSRLADYLDSGELEENLELGADDSVVRGLTNVEEEELGTILERFIKRRGLVRRYWKLETVKEHGEITPRELPLEPPAVTEGSENGENRGSDSVSPLD